MKTRVIIAIRGALAGVLTGTLALGACATQQTAERLNTRVENLEARDAQLATTEQRLARVEAQSEQMMKLAETMTARLEDLNARLEGLAAQQERAVARPPMRPPGPEPTVVYAVPVGDSPVEGPAAAKVTIRLGGSVESLNVAAAAAVLFYEAHRQRSRAPR